MPNIIPFQFDNYEVRIQLDDKQEPWWVLNDCCAVLGLPQPHRAASRIDTDDRKKSTVIDALGRQQEIWLINESGLYTLLLRSNKPAAKVFKRWVTHEVLPQIRKTGQYTPAAPKVRDPAIQMLIDMAVQLDEARTIATEAKQVALNAEVKANLALADAHHMTLEEFILKNGLIRQFPPGQYAAYTQWLKTFCLHYALPVHKAPVYGKSWDQENSYPLGALGAWLTYETKKPRQVHLITPTQEATP